MKFLCVLSLILLQTVAEGADLKQKDYRLQYNQAVPESPIIAQEQASDGTIKRSSPVDSAWENLSLPLGNGYLGANIFGRTQTERIQLSENSMASKGMYGSVGLTNFAELYLDFGHTTPKNYQRSLSLNNATSKVTYEHDGVKYERTYFASYPDQVLVIHLSANKKGALNFTVRPVTPYLREYGTPIKNGRTGKVSVEGNVLRFGGETEFIKLHYEGQVKVLPQGGRLQATQDAHGDHAQIRVNDADSATLIVALGTSFKLQSSTFDADWEDKVKDYPHPHEKVSAIIEAAAKKKYTTLLAQHIADYQRLFNRVRIDLGAQPSTLNTDQLLANYKQGNFDTYLDELYFNYGRYLLIASTRPGTLPPNLQGTWTHYEVSPWLSGYWHNINIQMNYWPVFTTNLMELFEPYVHYHQAYLNAAKNIATKYIRSHHPEKLDPQGDNGWSIGTGATPYNISSPGNHSGPGTGALTTKLFWDYYEFSSDRKVLQEVSYPSILGMAKFLSKVVQEKDGYLLTTPSFSPEQQDRETKKYIATVGSAFDQQMIYENHHDAIKAAQILGDQSSFIQTLQEQIKRLDPVQIGASGHIKEFREETFYGDIGEVKHRHLSQLVALCPGTLVSSRTPAWLDAARETLERRGDQSTGWAMAHRLNCWARVKEGERSYLLYQTLLRKGTLDNLWDTHPPFQIDGNFGGTAGVAEMLMQSHEGYIDVLPALPRAWSTGRFQGLMARGNFEVGLAWKDAHPIQITIQSNRGNDAQVHYPAIAQAEVRDHAGKKIPVTPSGSDLIRFKTSVGGKYTIKGIPKIKLPMPPSDLKASRTRDRIELTWTASPDAQHYRVYTLGNDTAQYELISDHINAVSMKIENSPLLALPYPLLRVTAVDAQGRESRGVRVMLSGK